MICIAKKTLLCGLLLLGMQGVGRLATIQHDGRTCYRLSNSLVEAILSPDGGGRVESFRPHGKSSVITVGDDKSAPGGTGIGQVRLLHKGKLRNGVVWTSWKVTASGSKEDRDYVTMESGGELLHFEKTFTLCRDSAALDVSWKIANYGTRDFIGNIWFVLSPFSRSATSFRYYFPFANHSEWPVLRDGKPGLGPFRWPADGNPTVNDAVAHWAAAINQRHHGLLLETNYADLCSFYCWLTRDQKVHPTLEYLTDELKIRPLSEGIKKIAERPEQADPLFDYVFRTNYHVMPLVGLEAVNACDNHLAADIVPSGDEIRVRLLSDRDYPDAVVEFSGHRQKVSLNALQVSEVVLQGFSKQKVVDVKVEAAAGNVIARLQAVLSAGAERPRNRVAKNRFFRNTLQAAPFFTDFSTSVIKWYPDAARRVKLLLFNTAWSHHDSAELSVRGNLDMDLVEVAYPHSMSFDINDNRSWAVPDPLTFMRDCLKRKSYDVIMIGSAIHWNKLPKDVREAIRRQVHSGTGLVYVDAPGGIGSLGLPLQFSEAKTIRLNRSVPWKHLQAIVRRGPSPMPLRAYDCRDGGTVVAVDYRLNQNDRLWMIDSYGLIPNPDFSVRSVFNEWDYHFSQLLKAIRMASQTVEPCEIIGVSPGHDRLRVEVASRAAAEAELILEVRDKYGRIVGNKIQSSELQSGDNALQVPLPVEQMTLDGNYFYNVFLKTGHHTRDWFTAVENRPAPASISAWQVTQKKLEPGDIFQGTVRLKGALRTCRLGLTLRDNFDRILYRKSWDVLLPEMTVKAPLQALPWSNYNTAELRLFEVGSGRLLDEATVSWIARLPRKKGISFTSWGACSNYFSADYYRVLYDMGFDETVGYHAELGNLGMQRSAAEKALQGNIIYAPMGVASMPGWLGEKITGKAVKRPLCLGDPSYLKKLTSQAKRIAHHLRDYCPNPYFIGDECSLFRWDVPHDYCQSQWCLADFRSWLKGRYPSLQALNLAWRTSFSTWDALKPSTGQEAAQRGCFTSFIDHRLFMFTRITQALKAIYDGMKASDSQGNLAISGMVSTNLYQGFDWHESLKYLHRAVAYDMENSGLDDVLRSFQCGSGCGDWSGYNGPVEEIREKNYREILSGLRANGHWANGFFMSHGDYHLNDYGRKLKSMIWEIRNHGLDVLTAPENRLASPFALFYSLPSMIVSDASDNIRYVTADKRSYNRNFGGWTALISNLGYQAPLVVSSAELATLDPSVSPYLILPLAQAMSDVDIVKIQTYVKRGGRLIADVMPGCCHENGIVRKDNPLESLFGAKLDFRTALGGKNGVLVQKQGKALMLEIGDETPEVLGGRSLCDFDRRLVIAKDGHLLLNVLLNRYGKIRKGTALAAPVLEFMREALRPLKPVSTMTVSLPSGAESMRYRWRGLQLIGLTRMKAFREDPSEASLAFDDVYLIYDLLQGKLLGRGDRLAFSLAPLDVRLLVLVRQEARPCKLKAVKVGRTCRIVIVNPGCDAAIRVEIVRPDGHVMRPVSGNHVCRGSGGQVELILDDGLEPHRGEWQIRVYNLLDGSSVSEKVMF